MSTNIYFAECLGRIKIGMARNVKLRLSALRSGAGAPVNLIASVVGTSSVERALHRKLTAYRIDGEWYRDCPEVRAAIQNSLNNFPSPGNPREHARSGSRRFGAVAKALWPRKTAAHLAALSGRDERTANRWLSGEFEPPAVVFAAILTEITKRDD